MSIFEQINQDIKKAMLAREKDKLEALRAVKSAFLLAKTDGSDGELTEEKEIQIVQKLVKQRRDAADIYKEQNRPDLYEPEVFQADIIAVYLPKQLTDEELKAILAEIVKEQNASGMKDMGKVMGIANAKLAGKADGKAISTIVRGLLT